jgi:hypothetical protein
MNRFLHPHRQGPEELTVPFPGNQGNQAARKIISLHRKADPVQLGRLEW